MVAFASSSVSSNIDFNADGVQHGFLKLPYSHNNSAWGAIMSPISMIKNGDGQTAFLTAGSHGDEYEGITSLIKLAHNLSPNEINGRVIILPMMNHPAVISGCRLSPIDNISINRSFPGNVNGSITEKMADYINRYLIPICHYALDLRSGGTTLDIIPYAASHRLHNKRQQAQCIEGSRIFGAPYRVVIQDVNACSLYDTAVETQGKVFVTARIGGGATTTPKSILITDRGIHNFLVYSGISNNDYIDPPITPIKLEFSNSDCFICSEHSGILEFYFTLGERVNKGDLIAKIHTIERSGMKSIEYRAKTTGLLAARRHLASVAIGDTFAVIAHACQP